MRLRCWCLSVSEVIKLRPAMVLPAAFPNLPGPGPPTRWGYSIVQAHDIISQSYLQSVHVLRREDGDPLRLRYHIQRLKGRTYPLLKSMESTQLPSSWIRESTHCLGQLLLDLEVAADGADTQWVQLPIFTQVLISLQWPWINC
jgi:hypothetical protein